jgi:hypothetical protein
VAQWPNLPLWVFLVLSIVIRASRPVGRAGAILRDAASAVLILWALDEVLRGVNPFRRLLGIAVLLLTIATLVALP